MTEPSQVRAGLGTARGLPPNVWTWLTYGIAALLAAFIGYFLVRMPFQMTDNIGNMLNLRNATLWELTADNFGGGPFLRPFLWSTFKVVFDLSGGHYHAAFKAVHAMQILALLLLCVRLMGVRTARDFTVATFALVVLLGYHTFSGFVFEAYPINSFLSIAIGIVAILNLAESRGGWGVDALAVALIVYCMFTVESGLLLWVALTTAWLAGARGVSRGGMVACTLATVGYFALRFVLLDGGTPGLDERSTGYWTRSLDPDELIRRFGDNPLPFYGYNVMSSFSSLLFAEPRAGIWDVMRYRENGDAIPPWLQINLATTISVTLPLIGFTVMRAWRWVRLQVAPTERLVVVFWGLAVANSVLSYAYTKDQIITPAGVLYALAAYVVFRHLVAFEWRMPVVVRLVMAAVVVVLATGWTLRAFGLGYHMNRSAYRQRDDWIEIEQWMEQQELFARPDDVAFVRRMRQQAVGTPVPHPYFVYQRYERFFDQRN